uniref:Uncharacterized protein n=1 Tax=Magallana gigas TaxID=29159 RepID=K1QAY4_MAGGI
MGEELEMEGLPKGPLSPTPESHGNCDTFSPVASYSPALDSNCSAFAPVTCTISQAEDSILTTLRSLCQYRSTLGERDQSDYCRGSTYKGKDFLIPTEHYCRAFDKIREGIHRGGGTNYYNWHCTKELKSKKSETTQSFPRLQKKWVH